MLDIIIQLQNVAASLFIFGGGAYVWVNKDMNNGLMYIFSCFIIYLAIIMIEDIIYRRSKRI